jgi:hypothetical protein
LADIVRICFSRTSTLRDTTVEARANVLGVTTSRSIVERFHELATNVVAISGLLLSRDSLCADWTPTSIFDTRFTGMVGELAFQTIDTIGGLFIDY